MVNKSRDAGRGKLKVIAVYLLLFSVFIAGVDAGNGHDEQNGTFPVWTYYAEIVEHSLLMIIAVVGIILLIKPYRENSDERKKPILMMIAGLFVLLVSQLLTNLHHFLIFPFEEWNAIVNHGLLTISVFIIFVAFFKLSKELNK